MSRTPSYGATEPVTTEIQSVVSGAIGEANAIEQAVALESTVETVVTAEAIQLGCNPTWAKRIGFVAGVLCALIAIGISLSSLIRPALA